MSLLFISHSSKDNIQAVAIKDWLIAEGWNDIFLDLDPEHGIAGGEKWEQALLNAANRCDAVLYLISKSWLASEWCRWEFQLAQKLNKRLFILLIEEIPIAELPKDLTESWQLVNLNTKNEQIQSFNVQLPDHPDLQEVNFSVSGLSRLKTGLNKAGLDPSFFAWPPKNDPDRAPYRGLLALEVDDAGIFFGRDAPIIDLMAQLRGLRELSAPRMMVVLGASGAGKSSFLRAGILPRLARDDRYFHVLPIIRPERAAIHGVNGLISCFVAALPSADQQYIESELAQGEDGLHRLFYAILSSAQLTDHDRLQVAAPTLVLSIDQGEELFQAEGSHEANQLLNIIRFVLTQDNPQVIVLFTIRSDSYEYLQSAAPLEGVTQKTFSLPAMPRGSYQQVIEGPAKLLSKSNRPLKVTPQLTEQLLQDIEQGGARDALPLLAFTLEQLYLGYSDDGELSRDDYLQMGGIEGAIKSAVEHALQDAHLNPHIPQDRDACLALLKRGLIPWLAGIDPQTNLPRRRVALMSEIPEEARPLIQHFIAHRLLATDTNERREITVEPAHEALLRQWSILKGWLEEDAAALSALESLRNACRDWEANLREDKWLIHTGGRLDDAEDLCLRDIYQSAITIQENEYLKACRKQENDSKEKEIHRLKELAKAKEKVAKRTKAGLVILSILMVVTIYAYLKNIESGKKIYNTMLTMTSEGLLRKSSELASSAKDLDKSLQLLLAASKIKDSSKVESQGFSALKEFEKIEWIENVGFHIDESEVDPTGNIVFLRSGNSYWLFNLNTRALIKIGVFVGEGMIGRGFSKDGKSFYVINQKEVSEINTNDGHIKDYESPFVNIDPQPEHILLISGLDFIKFKQGDKYRIYTNKIGPVQDISIDVNCFDSRNMRVAFYKKDNDVSGWFVADLSGRTVKPEQLKTENKYQNDYRVDSGCSFSRDGSKLYISARSNVKDELSGYLVFNSKNNLLIDFIKEKNPMIGFEIADKIGYVDGEYISYSANNDLAVRNFYSESSEIIVPFYKRIFDNALFIRNDNLFSVSANGEMRLYKRQSHIDKLKKDVFKEARSTLPVNITFGDVGMKSYKLSILGNEDKKVGEDFDFRTMNYLNEVGCQGCFFSRYLDFLNAGKGGLFNSYFVRDSKFIDSASEDFWVTKSFSRNFKYGFYSRVDKSGSVELSRLFSLGGNGADYPLKLKNHVPFNGVFSSDETELAVAAYDTESKACKILYFSVENGEIQREGVHWDCSKKENAFVVRSSETGKYIVAHTFSDKIYLIDFYSGSVIYESNYVTQFEHENGKSFSFSGGDRYFSYFDSENIFVIYDIDLKKVINKVNFSKVGKAKSILVDDTRYVALSNERSEVIILDISSNTVVKKAEGCKKNSESVQLLKLTASDLEFGCFYQGLTFYKYGIPIKNSHVESSRYLVQRYGRHAQVGGDVVAEIISVRDEVGSGGVKDKDVFRFYSINTGMQVGDYEPKGNLAYDKQFAVSKKRSEIYYFIDGSKDNNTLWVYNYKKDKEYGLDLSDWGLESFASKFVTLGNVGERLVLYSGKNLIVLKDNKVGSYGQDKKMVFSLGIIAVELSADEKFAIVMDQDNIHFVDIESGKIIKRTARLNLNGEKFVKLSHDAKYFVTYDDRTLQFWSADDLTPIGNRIDASGLGAPLEFSSDDKHLVGFNSSNYVVTPKGWSDIICKKLTKNMSLAEWNEWVSPDIPYKKQCENLPIGLD